MKQFFITQIVQAIVLICLYYFLGFDQWLGNKFKDLIIGTSVYFLVVFIGGFSFFFRPLFMNITLNNIVGAGEKSTHIHIENEELTTQQKHRTIAISVSIQRRGSVWWRLMKWILKHNEVSLCVQTSPSDVYIQPKDEFMINEIEANYERGFNILIKDIFVQLSQRKKGFSIMKKYEFFVLDHPDFTFPAASTYIIEPVVQVDKKDGIAPQWLYRFVCKRLLKYETETHEVKVFRR